MNQRLTLLVLVAGLGAFAASCDPAPSAPTPPAPESAAPAAPLVGSLDWAVAGPWRAPSERANDALRRPLETIDFFRIEGHHTVIDAWPVDGWYAAILGPYLTRGGGRYLAAFVSAPNVEEERDAWRAAFDQRFGGDEAFAAVGGAELSALGLGAESPTEADAVIADGAVHAWMALGIVEPAFADIFAALRPGGYLGLIEPRAPEGGPQDPLATSGYVQTSFVRRLAEEAGFVYVGQSDLHANPLDDADHPFGVWTLAPHGLTAPLGAPADPEFDRAAYDEIGAPDRMTLLFRKPRP